ncbi:unnamed protein product [Ranitomeya imitator]|uniref:Reverse transcriptase domain-containing protein n=1 Tax=Ranitomeya imitator TaxID=111125 RepID=A0ABN9LUS9_9NEOB|nr:unnamed protein product [Ranitomeya imitator]
MQDMVDSFILAITQTLNLKEDKVPTQEHSVSFKRVKRHSWTFPNHREFEAIMAKHWGHPEKRFLGRKQLDILYSFSPDLVGKWAESPKMDLPVSHQSSNTVLSLLDGVSLKDIMDKPIESLAKSAFEAAGASLCSIFASTWVAKSMSAWPKKESPGLESLRSVIASMESGEFLCSVDILDAYLNIPVYVQLQRFLRFAIQEDHYQFTALPFGLASAPRVFTKVMAAVKAILHSKGILIIPYLDDLMIKEASRQDWDQSSDHSGYFGPSRLDCQQREVLSNPSSTPGVSGYEIRHDPNPYPPSKGEVLISLPGDLLSKATSSSLPAVLHENSGEDDCIYGTFAQFYAHPLQLAILSAWEKRIVFLDRPILLPLKRDLSSRSQVNTFLQDRAIRKTAKILTEHDEPMHWNKKSSRIPRRHPRITKTPKHSDREQRHKYTEQPKLSASLLATTAYTHGYLCLTIKAPRKRFYSMCEMIQIMQEYGEVTCCMGSSASIRNSGLFLQSDISISLDPLFPSRCSWEMFGYVSDSLRANTSEEFSPLHLSAELNSLPCSLSFRREESVSIIRLIEQARNATYGIRKCFLFLLQCQLTLVIVQFLACLIQLPPCLSTTDILWLSCFCFPLLRYSL